MRNICTVGAAAFLLTATGAFPAHASPEEEDSTNPTPLGEAKADEAPSEVSIEVNSLERSPDGGVTSLVFTFKNTDPDEDYRVQKDLGDSVFAYGPGRIGGTTLLDEESDTRYFIASNSNDFCLCPNAAGGDVVPKKVEPESSQVAWSTFIVPDGVEAVTVEFPGFEPVPDVPIS